MSNPLTDVLPNRARKYAYAVAFTLSTAFGIWQAAEGNWTAFAAGFLSAATSALAGSNVNDE